MGTSLKLTASDKRMKPSTMKHRTLTGVKLSKKAARKARQEEMVQGWYPGCHKKKPPELVKADQAARNKYVNARLKLRRELNEKYAHVQISKRACLINADLAAAGYPTPWMPVHPEERVTGGKSTKDPPPVKTLRQRYLRRLKQARKEERRRQSGGIEKPRKTRKVRKTRRKKARAESKAKAEADEAQEEPKKKEKRKTPTRRAQKKAKAKKGQVKKASKTKRKKAAPAKQQKRLSKSEARARLLEERMRLSRQKRAAEKTGRSARAPTWSEVKKLPPAKKAVSLKPLIPQNVPLWVLLSGKWDGKSK
eukprot:TRINITY_DN11173_c0_g1_i1.p2 TRINITY_DN11173_c0_g1~~TRINITY_DN11173_c0_g1_i1.p2  ORF type:complete len:308 (+),score=95.86 TRINITY_DN11173_c0_g1_i1:96-1019(+)